MTCSAFQSTCVSGWGGWGGCTNGWQFRVCDDNAQLGQTQCCDAGCGSPVGAGTPQPPPPEEPIVPEPTPSPVPVGTILARAVEMQPTDITCADVRAISTGNSEINGSILGFTQSSASQPTPLTQSGANYVSFPSLSIGSYTIDPQPLGGNWMLTASCWTNSNGANSTGFSTTLGDGETLQWDIGYTWGTSWVQTNGGDVYASGSLKSFIPDITPRVFSTSGTGGSPGVVTYGTTYDFDGGTVGQGPDRVSPTNWLVNETRSTIDYYDYFYRRYGSPTVTDNASFINLAAVEQPASRATPYYIDGDMTTSGDWVVGDGENVVFIVTGNLTIGGQINITGTGFVAFIVNGQYLTIDSSVGTTAASTTPVVEGVYVVSPSGTFQTGLSTSVGTAKFVGKGMFIAGNFLLQRDLDLYGGNTLYPPELFVYNPKLLVTMPDEMKELPVIWQEVAP